MKTPAAAARAQFPAESSGALLDAYKENRSALKRYLTQRLRCPEVAEDLIQETWLRIADGENGSALGNPRAYLFRIASNLAIDHHRRETRRSEIVNEAGDAIFGGTDELTPERHHLARAELASMKRAIAALPERCREVFYLSRFEQVPRHEIARRLDISMTTVEKDLRRVLRQLAHARSQFRDAPGPYQV